MDSVAFDISSDCSTLYLSLQNLTDYWLGATWLKPWSQQDKRVSFLALSCEQISNMKQISAFLLLAPVVLFIGCGPAIDGPATETPSAIKNDSKTAVQPTEQTDKAQTETTGADMTNSDPAKSDMTKPDTASDSTTEIVFGDKFPEVLAVKVSAGQDNQWRFDVTLSSAYDTPQRYADAWRVLSDQDNELGIRILGHDHGDEQPFTRSGPIEIPTGTQTVFVEGRDQENGWSGQRFKVQMP